MLLRACYIEPGPREAVAALDISTVSGYAEFMITSGEIAEQMKREILEDAKEGVIPETITAFADLHKYVDANCYGGTEKLLDAAHDAAPDTEEGHTQAWNSFCGLVNPAADEVDAWIKSGGLAVALTEKSPQ